MLLNMKRLNMTAIREVILKTGFDFNFRNLRFRLNYVTKFQIIFFNALFFSLRSIIYKWPIVFNSTESQTNF